MGNLISSSNVVNVQIGQHGENDVPVQLADLVVLIDSGIVYPKSKSVDDDKEIKKATVVVDYTCVNHKCQLAAAMETIQNGPKAIELKGLGVHELTNVIVKVIDANQNVFLPSSVNGFVFQSVSNSFLPLRYATEDRNPDDIARGRFGFIYLREVTQWLLFVDLR